MTPDVKIKPTITVTLENQEEVTVDAEEFEKVIRKMVNTKPLPMKKLVQENRKKRTQRVKP